MVRRFFQSEVRDRGTGYRRTAAVPGATPVHHQHRVAHGPAVLVRGASPIRRVGQTSSRRADRHTGTPWPPSMGSGIPTTRRPVCGARRRPPYCTKMTRDMGTSSNALRITWFGQRHLTSTLRPIIAQRTGVRKWPFCGPHRGRLFAPGGGFPADSPPEEPSRARDSTSGRRNSMGIHSIGIHSNGMGAIPMESIGMQCIEIHSIPMDSNRLLSAEGNGLVKTTNESGGAFTTIPVTPQITWR